MSARHAVAGLAPTGLAQAQAVAERFDPTSPCGARGRRQLALFLSMTQRTVVGVDLSYNSLSKGHAFKRREGSPTPTCATQPREFYDDAHSPNLGRILLLERWARI